VHEEFLFVRRGDVIRIQLSNRKEILMIFYGVDYGRLIGWRWTDEGCEVTRKPPNLSVAISRSVVIEKVGSCGEIQAGEPGEGDR